jgi:O-antigen/teichoic acid export membrane protein
VVAMAIAGGIAGTVLWVAAAPDLARWLFAGLSTGLVAWAGITVFTQLMVATGKGCCQGSDDLRGANRVIVLEEFLFLPAYGLTLLLGIRGYAAMIVSLVAADVATAGFAWTRRARRGWFRDAARPAWAVARRVAGYGIRAQIGGVMALLNLRLDFVILGGLAGPAVLGTYAIASKFAELLRIPSVALTYVLYPRFSGEEPSEAGAEAGRLMPRAAAGVAMAAVPLAVAATVLLPLIYGPEFASAIAPAHILIVGLAAEGAAAVATAFLYGVGRPGLNSVAVAIGLLCTVAFDVLLIPSLGAIGAAWASTIAYLTSTAVLMICFWAVIRRPRRQDNALGSSQPAGASAMRARP